MSLNQLHNQISQSWIGLDRHFKRSQEFWDDGVRNQFERDYWQGFHAEMSPYLSALDDLARTVQQARQSIR
ncbi:MAG: hypothetical protein PHW11_06245 [Anaerolineaceae bacterium]|jgi:uncharacterized protein YukE|nr:hypothetical protein [Anaerolineaceae bacterium]MDD4042432.1 hypothetical protein [Anaerolineaceae bacterium]MDD4577139.1 hypothetical protein [Anaerolineaceae bacterium]